MLTIKEAISRLKEGEPFSEIHDPVWDEALRMAISALSDRMDAEEAYYRGKIEGINECTEKLKKLNEKLARGKKVKDDKDN